MTAWSIIVIPLLSSVVVSAICSSLITFLLKNRKDLRDRKIEAYRKFLAQQVQMNSHGNRDVKFMETSLEKAINDLQKCMWEVSIVGDATVALIANAIMDEEFRAHHIMIQRKENKISKEEFAKRANEYISKILELQSELILAIREDINRWWW